MADLLDFAPTEHFKSLQAQSSHTQKKETNDHVCTAVCL